MDPDHRQRLSAILLSLDAWEDPRSRKALLGFLRGHDIRYRHRRDGSSLEAADDLLALCSDPDLARIPVLGRTPLCALIAQLKDHLPAYPTRLEELARLSEALCVDARVMPRLPWSKPPYPGLNFFDRDDWPIYFGRETELTQLIQALAGTPPQRPGPGFLAVIGASGSGKSSLVRAGLWARLAAGRIPELPGGEHWLVTAMMPADPIADDPLAHAVPSKARRGRVVVRRSDWRQSSAAVVSGTPRPWERPLAAICAGETRACASRPEAAPTGPSGALRHSADRP
jgi:hypothetical protein